jgi:hypothetical protein
MQQIDNRTFQTQLFLGPTSNPSQAALDVMRSATGERTSVTSVVVLPQTLKINP